MMTTLMAVGFVACLQGETTSPGSGRAVSQGAKAMFDARRAEVRFPKGRVISAEIADTPERVARGYMYRTQVGEKDGMIFVFPVPDVHPFWMKNTLVPLDMIWMDEEFAVLHIQPSAPPCKTELCPSYGPLRKAAYVLEVRGGTTADEGLKVGDRLEIVLPGGEGGGS